MLAQRRLPPLVAIHPPKIFYNSLKLDENFQSETEVVSLAWIMNIGLMGLWFLYFMIAKSERANSSKGGDAKLRV